MDKRVTHLEFSADRIEPPDIRQARIGDSFWQFRLAYFFGYTLMFAVYLFLLQSTTVIQSAVTKSILAFVWAAVTILAIRYSSWRRRRRHKTARDTAGRYDKIVAIETRNRGFSLIECDWMAKFYSTRDLIVTRNIHRVRLNGELVTNEALRSIAVMPEIRELWISGTKINENGLQFLRRLPNLNVLYLDGTKHLRPTDCETLQTAIVGLKVVSKHP